MASEPCLRFAPVRAEGWPDVTEVAVHSDRLEFLSAGEWKAFRFEDMAQWPRPVWLRKRLARLTGRRPFLPVAERDWFHQEGGKFFRFYTEPPLTVFLPAEEGVGYHQSLFRRIQAVMFSVGGYGSWDLG